MLAQLRVRDYALIDDLTIELRPGLTVLTGETGAGKSIIIGALSLLLGDRPDPDMIRTGASSALVEGRFEKAGANTPALQKLGIDLPDGTLILRRKAERSGRGSVHANDSSITVAALTALGDALVDLHGQHQHQLLLRQQVHIDLLDALAGLLQERNQFSALFTEHEQTKQELQRLEAELARRREQRELAEFQWKELSDAGLQPGVVAALSAERELLQSAERRYALAAQAADILSEQDGSATELLAAARKALAELARLDPALAARRDALAEAEAAVSDTWREVIGYRDAIDFSAERLEQVNARLFAIEKL